MSDYPVPVKDKQRVWKLWTVADEHPFDDSFWQNSLSDPFSLNPDPCFLANPDPYSDPVLTIEKVLVGKILLLNQK